jgi:hypothetical protein
LPLVRDSTQPIDQSFPLGAVHVMHGGGLERTCRPAGKLAFRRPTL